MSDPGTLESSIEKDQARPRVLVVDDEAFFREAIGDILEEAEYECVFAEDGTAAIERAARPGIGVVVLDVRLPDMDGLEVLAALRQQFPELRVIMLSAHTDQEVVLEALRVGACDYLAKPLHDEELTLAVDRAASSHLATVRYSALRQRVDALADELQELGTTATEGDAEARLKVVRETAARVATRALGARRSSLLLLSENGDSLDVVAAEGGAVPAGEIDPVPLVQSVAGRAFKLGEPLVVRSIADDPRFAELADAGERYQTGSFAITPVLGERGPIGLLCAADREGGGSFSDEDLPLLRVLALEVGRLLTQGDAAPSAVPSGELAIPLLEGEAGADRDAELARVVCDASAYEVEPEPLLRTALSALGRELPAVPASILLHARGSDRLMLEAEWDGGARSDRTSLPVERGLTGVVFASGQLVASAHPETDPRFDPEIDTPEDGVPTPLLLLPLTLRGQAVGVCRLFLEPDAAVSARTGEVLGAALSAAVRNVLLYRSLVEAIDEVAEVRRAARG